MRHPAPPDSRAKINVAINVKLCQDDDYAVIDQALNKFDKGKR